MKRILLMLGLAMQVCFGQATLLDTKAAALNTAAKKSTFRQAIGLNVLRVEDYGAVGDAQMRVDGEITAGTATYTSASANFQPSDVGPSKIFIAEGMGVAGADVITYIASRTNSTTVTLAVAATTTVSSRTFKWGTDDSVAIQNAVNAASLSVPRIDVTFNKPAYLVNNIAVPRGLTLRGFNGGMLLSDITEAYRLHDPVWATTLISKSSANPILSYPDAFGSKIERLVFAGSKAKTGTAIQLGPVSAGVFGGTGIELTQLTFLGFDKAIRDRHCNQVLGTAINMLDSTSGFWFGADSSAGGVGHGGVNIRGIQTIGVDYPFNTAANIGMRVTVAEADFNYGIRVARLESLSFFNATTINIEDFTGEVVGVYQQSATVNINGISRLRSDIPIIANYSTGNKFSVTGDINGSGIYRTASSEYPLFLDKSMVIQRYTSTAWSTLGETEWASLIYTLPFQQVNLRPIQESWTLNLAGAAGTTVGNLGWKVTGITGTWATRLEAGQPGTCNWYSSGSTVSDASRFALNQPIGYIDASNYWQAEFTFYSNQASKSKTRIGLYELEGVADMDPTYGVGLIIDPSVGANAYLEIRVGGTSTRVDTGVAATTFDSTSIRLKINRRANGVYLVMRNSISGALVGTQVFSAATLPGGAVTLAGFCEITTASFQNLYFSESNFRRLLSY